MPVDTISVTPERLMEKGEELEKIVRTLASQFEEVQNVISSSGNYWIGEAADALRKQYAEIHADVSEALGELAQYPVKLQEIAKVYMGHDYIAIEKAEALPGNGLE